LRELLEQIQILMVVRRDGRLLSLKTDGQAAYRICVVGARQLYGATKPNIPPDIGQY